MQSRSWLLKLGLSCFWLTTGLFIAKEFYLSVQFHYLEFFLVHLGGSALFQFFKTYTLLNASLFETLVLFLCFLELLSGFYVLIYPPVRILLALQMVLLFPIFAYAVFDHSLWYHPFGALSKTFCVFAVLLAWRQLYIQKHETQARKTLLWATAMFWIYQGLVYIAFQSPFLLNPQNPQDLLPSGSLRPFLFSGLGWIYLISGFMLLPFYASRYRLVAVLFILLHLLILIATDIFYLTQIFHYLYHPLGGFTKDFVLVAMYLYLLQDPLSVESKKTEHFPALIER